MREGCFALGASESEVWVRVAERERAIAFRHLFELRVLSEDLSVGTTKGFRVFSLVRHSRPILQHAFL